MGRELLGLESWEGYPSGGLSVRKCGFKNVYALDRTKRAIVMQVSQLLTRGST